MTAEMVASVILVTGDGEAREARSYPQRQALTGNLRHERNAR